MLGGRRLVRPPGVWRASRDGLRHNAQPGDDTLSHPSHPPRPSRAASCDPLDDRLITRSGVIVRRGHDMPLARISDIAYEFGPIDRMLGCGTLVISDASTHGQIKLHDIPRVEEAQRTINDLLQRIHDRSGGHEGT